MEDEILDSRSKDEMPFVVGSIFVEARKPASRPANKSADGTD
ncbi:hypothetical protein ACFLQU_05850 [Verrucomicrobiota bacterium]